MAIEYELVRNVDFEPGFNKARLRFNEDLGFLEVNEADIATSGIRVVGFSIPVSRSGGIDMSNVVSPITTLEGLPPANRIIDSQGKGVGPRLYNTWQALGGSRLRPDTIGVYSVGLDPSKLLDLRASQGNRVQQVVRHAGRILRSKLTSVEKVVDGIHRSYGDVDAVELFMPPHPEIRQLQHGVSNPIKPQFIIIRNPYINMHRIGTAPAPW